MRKGLLIIMLLALFLNGCGAQDRSPDDATGSMSETIVPKLPTDPADSGAPFVSVKDESAGTTAAETMAEKTGRELPIDTPGGLRVVSLFPYTGINPDADDESCTDVAGAEIVNMSGRYLVQADLELLFIDGSALTLHLEDIPAGASVYVFDASNQSSAQLPAVSEIRENAIFSDDAAMPDGFSAEAEGMLIRIKAANECDAEQITVVYHCVLDGVLFGGISYSQTIPAPKSDSEAQLTAEECIFGEAQVVCVRK